MFFQEIQTLGVRKDIVRHPHNFGMKTIVPVSLGTLTGHLRIARSIMSIRRDNKIGEILFGISITLFTVILSNEALLAALLQHTTHGNMILEMSDQLDLHRDSTVQIAER